MTTFLSIIGLIALFIFGKFIYDTYLTSNTEKDWALYKSEYPEDAARIEKNEKPQSSTKAKSREEDKILSLLHISKQMNCLPKDAEINYLQKLKASNLNAAEVKKTIQNCKEKKYEQSKAFNMNPDDTPAAFCEKWTTDFFDSDKLIKFEIGQKEVIHNLLNDNPDLDRILKSGDKTALKSFMANNSNLVDSFFEDISISNDPVERLRRKAIDKMFDENDYTSAIQLLTNGIALNSTNSHFSEINVSLFDLRAECYKNVLDFEFALIDIDTALEFSFLNTPINNLEVSTLLGKKAEIIEKLGESEKAIEVKEKAKKYYELYEINKYLQQPNNLGI